MMEELIVTGRQFSELLEAVRNNQGVSTVSFTGYGISMTPFIRNGSRLTVSIYDGRSRIRKGEIVAVQGAVENSIIIHRVIRARNGWYLIKGDNKKQADGWFPQTAVVGTVTAKQRGTGRLTGFCHWQNLAVAIMSQSGVLNLILLPAGRWIKKKMSRL